MYVYIYIYVLIYSYSIYIEREIGHTHTHAHTHTGDIQFFRAGSSKSQGGGHNGGQWRAFDVDARLLKVA